MLNSKYDVNRFEKRWRNYNDFIKHGEQRLDNEAKSKWDRLKEEEAQNVLRQMPVDVMGDVRKNLPLSALKSDGFQTMADVRYMLVEDFSLVPGIGEKSAEILYDVKERVVAATVDNAKPKINPDKLSNQDLAFLTVIYKKINFKKEKKKLQKTWKAIEKLVVTYLPIAKMKTNWLLELFQGEKKRNKIDQALRKLSNINIEKAFKDVDQLVALFQKEKIAEDEIQKDFIQQNATYYAEMDTILNVNQSEMSDLPESIVDEIRAFPIELNGMNATLRHYQDFGAKYALHFKRTLLGDEMGLGKTMQALAMFQHLSNQKKDHHIVICPLSLLSNWERETKKFTKMKTYIFHGAKREAAKSAWIRRGGILITTYEHAIRLDLQATDPLNAIVVDEAHYIKNPQAKRSQSVNMLVYRAEYALLMSGTPLENKLDEMKQLISTLKPEIANHISTELYMLEPSVFRELVAPVYLRRNRDAVLDELPTLNEIELYVPFGEEEAKEYERAVYDRKMMAMRQAAWSGGSPHASPKLERLIQICEEARENGNKVLVFSFFRNVLNVISEHLKDSALEQITGDISPAKRQEIIDEFTEAKDGTVLVSQITAGGTGLNIQAANIVVLCEPQWKPSIEEQAISRAYRMGQARPVTVYRIYTENSVDETIHDLLQDKKAIFDAYARESNVGNESLLRHMEEKSKQSVEKQAMEIERKRLAVVN